MDEMAPVSGWLRWVDAHSTQLVLTAACLLLYGFLDRVSKPRLIVGGEMSRLKAGATNQGRQALRILGSVLLLAALIIVWGIDISALLVLSTTIITLTGVALFASWSLLSNVTAYFVILFNPSFARGNFLRVIDLDNYIEGYISEVNLFHTKLITEHREVILYPNNLLLVKPCQVNPRNRLNVVGKILGSGPDSLRDTQSAAVVEED